MKNILIFISILSISILSCDKMDSEISDKKMTENSDISILKFTNQEEYNSKLSQVVSLSLDDLISYEETKGYKSFGRKCEEFYRNIDMEQFTTKDEILSFVEGNNEYLQLIDDDNGEFEIETKYYYRADRYFLNKDFMFQVGDTLYKALVTGTLVANINDISISEMKNVKSNKFKSTSGYRFIPLYNDETLKSTNSYCGLQHVWRSTNRKDRLKVVIEMQNGFNKVKCHFLARPYKKTFGVWYHCGRTMKADVRIDYTYSNGPTATHRDQPWSYHDKVLNYYHGWAGSSKYEKTLEHWTYLEGTGYFTGYDVWVDTYSVSPIDIYCN